MDTANINNIESEIIVGLTGGLGVDFSQVADQIAVYLAKAGYHIEIIRIADNFVKKDDGTGFAACYWKMQYGTKQRQVHGNDFWAKKVITNIFMLRPQLAHKHKKIAYIIRSLKNKEELELFSNVYGRNFIAVSIFSEQDATVKFLTKKLKLGRLKISEAQQQMQAINLELNIGSDVDITEADNNYLHDASYVNNTSEQDRLVKFLMRKDQEETHPELREYGQNLFKCYSIANFFVYQDMNLDQQIKRLVDLIFNYPFAEPTYEEYFMFCAQSAAYRSLDLDRQIGAVIVNVDNELVASGFNDVSKVGGGHFAHHDHPFKLETTQIDQRDYKLNFDYNHKYLDEIAGKIAVKLHLGPKDLTVLREEIRGITEFKRSTHAEMSALLDASRRGVAVRNCTMYVNTYPCHNCTKHIMASGIKKVIFLHPYTKSKAREMYSGMIRHGLSVDEHGTSDVIYFEPFLGVSPNRFFTTFANDKDTRLERENGKETGKIKSWAITKDSIPRDLIARQPYSYIVREWVVIHNKLPDMSSFYNT